MSLDGVQVHLVDSVDEAGEFMRWLSTHDRVALDTECSGLDKDADVVRLVQFGDAREAWAIPYARWGGVADEAVRKFEGTYATHNGPMYDCPMLRRAGAPVASHRVDDTRLMLHVLESTGSLALKNAAKRLVDPRAAIGQQILDDAMTANKWDWATVPDTFEPYWFYGGVDTVLTYQLDEVLKPRVMAEAPRSYELELAVSWVAEKMERRGVRVDREYTRELSRNFAEYAEQADRWCRENFGVNPGSNVQVAQRLLDDGVGLTERTASGQWALDKHVLGALDHPLAPVVLQRRGAVKMDSTYLRHYLEMSLRDGRIHPSINTIGGTDKNPFEPGGGSGVRTGRMSMSDPNLQNVPIRTETGKLIRNCFLPSEGGVWIKADFDQIEMRLLAHLAGARGMIEAFKSEGDFFVNIARELFSEPGFTKDDPRRSMVKNGGYSKIYSAGPERFAKTAGVELQTATTFMTSFDRKYPEVPAWIRSIERLGRGRYDSEGVAYVRSPLTGRRHVADAWRLYTLVNYLIQGLAGEVLKLKIVEADAAGLGEYMTLPVHDEIDLDVPASEVDEVVATIREVMNDERTFDVPVTASVEVGDRWGSAVDYERWLADPRVAA